MPSFSVNDECQCPINKVPRSYEHKTRSLSSISAHRDKNYIFVLLDKCNVIRRSVSSVLDLTK